MQNSVPRTCYGCTHIAATSQITTNSFEGKNTLAANKYSGHVKPEEDNTLHDVSNLAGVIPALITPLTPDGNFDPAGMRRLVRYVLDAGVHGVFVMGSSGEFYAFTPEERRQITEFVVDEVGGRVPVFCGISDHSTNLAIRNGKEAKKAGADVAVLVLPYYATPARQEDMAEHFRYVRDHIDMPLAMYNVPQAVKGFVKLDTIAELAEDGTIVALKDSTCDFNHFQQVIIRLSGMRFPIFQGSEPQLACSVLMGGHGGVLGLGNVAPRLCVDIFNAAHAGRAEDARKLQAVMTRLWDLFWVGESPMTGMKAAVSLLGICGPTTARPTPQVSRESMERIRGILEQAGLTPRA